MRGFFWNSNKFKDHNKHRFISDLMKEQGLCFIAVLETGRKGFNDSVLRNLCGGKIFLWHCKEPRGRLGGILLGIDLDTFDQPGRKDVPRVASVEVPPAAPPATKSRHETAPATTVASLAIGPKSVNSHDAARPTSHRWRRSQLCS
jgi:hypothetical protein